MIVKLKCKGGNEKREKRNWKEGRVGRGQKELRQVAERRGENDK